MDPEGEDNYPGMYPDALAGNIPTTSIDRYSPPTVLVEARKTVLNGVKFDPPRNSLSFDHFADQNIGHFLHTIPACLLLCVFEEGGGNRQK